MATIHHEQAGDSTGIETLLDTSFGAGRRDLTVYDLRRGDPVSGLSFVMRDEHHRVFATIRYWRVSLAGQADVLLLGPLAVCPTMKGHGFGKNLVSHSLDAARLEGWPLCLVVGNPAYYRPFGFTPAAPYGLSLPGPVENERFQVIPFRESAITLLSSPGPKPVVLPPMAGRCLRPTGYSDGSDGPTLMKAV